MKHALKKQSKPIQHTFSKILSSSRIASDEVTLPPGEFTRSTKHLTSSSVLIFLSDSIISYDKELPIEPSTVTTATFSTFEGNNFASRGASPIVERINEAAVLDSATW